MTVSIQRAREILQQAELLYTAEQVQTALQHVARQINAGQVTMGTAFRMGHGCYSQNGKADINLISEDAHVGTKLRGT